MKLILLFFTLITSVLINAQPPYSGTIFIDPDIITSSDPSAFQSATYSGQKTVTMFDRRVNNWVNVNAYLFDVIWNDSLTSVAQVNAEFASVENALTEAEKYAFVIGQLPHILRVDVDEIWIHKGTQPFGGGNHSILIHTGQSTLYENDGILEETLVHEASHTSLDASIYGTSNWNNAVSADDEFISTYARDNPEREDVAESFLPWLMVRYRSDKISTSDYNAITQTIPNRLTYFDSMNYALYPFNGTTGTREIAESNNPGIYPNPVKDFIYLDVEAPEADLRIYNLIGQDFTKQTSYKNGMLNVTRLPAGYYVLKTKTSINKLYKQ